MENNRKLEVCVLCGKETNVPVDQHISQRNFYVEGCGQLCRKCYTRTYGDHLSCFDN